LEGKQSVAYPHHVEQKNAEKRSEELLEVHRGGCQDRVDRISSSTLWPITFQPVFALQMSYAWLDRGTAFHPSPSWFRCTSSSSLVDMLGDPTVMVVASIAHVHVRLTDPGPDYVVDLLHLCSHRGGFQ